MILESIIAKNIEIMSYNQEFEFQEWEYVDNKNKETVYEQIEKIKKIIPLGISRVNDLSYVAVDLNNNHKIYGLLYDNYNDKEYSFDVIVLPEAQGMGLGARLVDAAIENFKYLPQVFQNIKMVIHVVNPAMKKILENKGFFVTDESDKKNEWIMTRDD